MMEAATPILKKAMAVNGLLNLETRMETGAARTGWDKNEELEVKKIMLILVVAYCSLFELAKLEESLFSYVTWIVNSDCGVCSSVRE